ncbi:hypothetical protein I3843_14G113700 [Carya illinoinensis]|nr:hypothetical protein I3843_14G113700 [Carya illinoinensis]
MPNDYFIPKSLLVQLQRPIFLVNPFPETLSLSLPFSLAEHPHPLLKIFPRLPLFPGTLGSNLDFPSQARR